MPRSRQNNTVDAITLLKNDHRTVEALFAKFEKAKTASQKEKLAYEICAELTVHTIIEEELFYPMFKDAIEDDILNEAYVEHDGAKVMIAEILAASPSDAFYDAKVKVLSEEIKHHVKEEEQRGGLFAQARKTDCDFEELGGQLLTRKEELKAKFSKQGLPKPETRTMQGAKLVYGEPIELAA